MANYFFRFLLCFEEPPPPSPFQLTMPPGFPANLVPKGNIARTYVIVLRAQYVPLCLECEKSPGYHEKRVL